jgi:transcriptional regulator with XRE-family HTH domain
MTVEGLSERFVLAQEATGLTKTEFAARVGLTPQQLSNIKSGHNPPSHEAIYRAMQEFGFTADWFYLGSRVGFRDPDLGERLRIIERR